MLDRGAGVVEEQDAELVAADPRGDVALAGRAPDDTRDGAQRVVACAVAECVVDLLESVEIEEEEGDHRAVAAGAIQRLLAEGGKPAAVVEPREIVGEREPLELRGLFGELRRLFGEA